MMMWWSRLAQTTAVAAPHGIWSTGTAKAVMTPGQVKRVRRDEPTLPSGELAWDLIRDEADLRHAGIDILYLFGEVMDFDGNPLVEARVDIWQCGPDGVYRDVDADTDRVFAGNGSAVTDLLGHFMFRTILPVVYEGRAPHIHTRVTPTKGRALTTQIYLVDDPRNAQDWHYMSLGATQQAALSIDPVRRLDGDLEAGFNFVL